MFFGPAPPDRVLPRLIIFFPLALIQQGAFFESLVFMSQYPSFTFDSIILSFCSAFGQLFIYHTIKEFGKCFLNSEHSLIRVVLIQSCPAGAENFTNYVLYHPQFSSVIQNIENRCAVPLELNFEKTYFYSIKLANWHRQIGVKMAQRFSIFWITPLNCGWQNT